MGVLLVSRRQDSSETPGEQAIVLPTEYYRRAETLPQRRHPTAAATPQWTPPPLTRNCRRRGRQHCPTEAARARPVSPSHRGASEVPGRSQPPSARGAEKDRKFRYGRSRGGEGPRQHGPACTSAAYATTPPTPLAAGRRTAAAEGWPLPPALQAVAAPNSSDPSGHPAARSVPPTAVD